MSDNLKVEMLEKHHVMQLLPKIQERQRDIPLAMQNDPFFVTLMRKAGPALAFVSGDQVLACAGLIDYVGSGRAVLWCAFAGDIKREFLPVVNLLKKMRTFYPRTRYEAHIDPDFIEAQRLVKAAGFTCEAPMMTDYDGSGLHKQLWALTGEAT